MTSSTTLSSSIFWSGPLGPQVTSTSSLLGSQHVAVISDGALPTLWQMLRRFLILLEVNERAGPWQHRLPFRPQRTLDGLKNLTPALLLVDTGKVKKNCRCYDRLPE